MSPEALYYNAVNIALHSDYKKISNLRDRSGSWAKAWQDLRLQTSPEKVFEALGDSGGVLLLREDPRFPALLREIPWPPWGIYVQGSLDLFEKPALAIVGTRRATEAGQSAAREFGAAIAKTGVVVISGLAFGIDASAHRGALDADGQTLAVLAGGLDNVSPRTNREIAERILRTGALVSEYPFGAEPLAHRFLERNRLIAGLAAGVLVVEAPLRSGSLATARFAVEQNRQVFVVPGPIRHPNFEGSHRLIRSGAELVTKPEEVLEALGIAATPSEYSSAHASPEIAAVLAALEKFREAASIDKISELTNLNIQTVSQTLTMLEIEGRVQEDGQGYTLR